MVSAPTPKHLGEYISEMFSETFIEQFAADVAAKVLAQIAAGGPAKRLFTIPEAAQYLGRTPKAVEHLVARGTIPVTKLDGKRQIDRAALDKLISDLTYFEV